ncbi:hypothetical protein ACQ4M4_16365 [Leptolyngbya sp. AN02str]|uniref:hypothetical protein n=1 Tax=Leptolyngbya sp. AN02str TaxID=3423363 RepID=UPI003D310087
MACSAEQSRLNGAKSRGAITERGKAIASRNATKHGLLATQPPILATEDLGTFQGMMQGLIDQYQPQSPIEHLLVQQVAMGWQRLHRVWGCEAAIANTAMLKQERQEKTPTIRHKFYTGTLENPIAVLELEQAALKTLLSGIEDQVIWGIPKRGFQKWLGSKAAGDLLKTLHRLISQALKHFPSEALPPSEELRRGLNQTHTWSQLIRWKQSCEDFAGAGYVFRCLVPELQKTCVERVGEVETILSDVRWLSQAAQTAAIASKAIPQDIERLSRYERHIWRSLQDAIDRLDQIQRQRQTTGSMGSFG